jgi:hypothetical protein
MILGQSAAVAASLAIDSKTDIQQVDYEQLKQILDSTGQVLTLSGRRR